MPDPLPPLESFEWVVDRPIKIGGDFAGINTFGLSAKCLGIPHEEVFLSDNDPACQKMLMWHFPKCKTFFGDVTERDVDMMDYVDVYVSTFPCQDYSKLGLQQGNQSVRGCLFEFSIEYIKKKQPKVVLMENVANLFSRFRDVYEVIVRELEKLGYDVINKVDPLTNTKYHGVPQSRPRMVLVSVRKDIYAGSCMLPEPLKDMVKLQALIKPTALAGHLPNSLLCRKRVRRAWEKVRRQGHRPETDVVVTDIGASHRFANTKVNVMPCLTATRCAQYGFYVSTLGGKIRSKDMLRAHGLPDNFYDHMAAKVSKRQFGHQLGNAVSGCVWMRYLPPVLMAAKLVKRIPKDFWKSGVETLKGKGLTEPVHS